LNTDFMLYVHISLRI